MSWPLTAFRPAGDEALVLNEVAWVLIIGATLIFLLTMSLLALSLRRRKRDVPAKWWIVGGGLIFPSAVLTALLFYTTARTSGLERLHPPDALTISIVGRMWWWEVRYRDPSGARSVVLANEIHVPVGEPVVLLLSSEDVIHSLWIPALGGKMDTVPGRLNRLVFRADRPGVYQGLCAEYCGTQHARMGLHVVAQPRAEFDRWLAHQASNAAVPNSAIVERGRAAFMQNGCAACHAIRGLSGAAALGPDLTHVASRMYLGAGVLRNDRNALARWVTNVQAHKPGARMPSYTHFDAATLDALSAYLASLQ